MECLLVDAVTPAELLAHLRSLGLRVRADGERLLVTGKPGAMTPDLAEQVKTHKQELLDLLWFEVPFEDAPWLRRWGEEYDDRPAEQHEEEGEA